MGGKHIEKVYTIETTRIKQLYCVASNNYSNCVNLFLSCGFQVVPESDTALLNKTGNLSKFLKTLKKRLFFIIYEDRQDFKTRYHKRMNKTGINRT